MLVLSRHPDESIIINDNIVVTVVDVRGDKVRIGVAAPAEVPVHRLEVHMAIDRERRQRGEETDPLPAHCRAERESVFAALMTLLGGRDEADSFLRRRCPLLGGAVPDEEIAAGRGRRVRDALGRALAGALVAARANGQS